MGLTQKEIAERLNVSQPSLSGYIHGTTISHRFFLRLCAALEIAHDDPSWFDPLPEEWGIDDGALRFVRKSEIKAEQIAAMYAKK